MSEYQQYRRSQIAELRPYVPGEDMREISVSHEDEKNGSPKLGDMIARNPKNHNDRWLVAARYFADNFEPVQSLTPAESDLQRVFDRISTRLNDVLCEMKPGYDDSIVGFNEAWDEMRAVFKDELARRSQPESYIEELEAQIDAFGKVTPQQYEKELAQLRAQVERLTAAAEAVCAYDYADNTCVELQHDVEALRRLLPSTDRYAGVRDTPADPNAPGAEGGSPSHSPQERSDG